MSASELTAGPSRSIPKAFWKGEMWWTLRVNQFLASHLAGVAGRSGVSPNMLSLTNAVVGLSTSAVVIAIYPTSRIVAAAAALLGWQLAYTLDCADGQLARSTNQASSVGALLDIACDYVVQVGVVVALVVVAGDSVPSAVAAPVAVAIGGGWLLAPFYAAIGGTIERPLGYEKLRRRLVLVKQVRDYGLQIGVFPVLMLVGSLPVALGLVVVAVANLSFLVVRLAGLKPLARVR